MSAKKVVGVIPARFGSTRFQGKPLKKILDKPLLQWVIEGAQKSKKLDEVWVATDHSEIESLAQKSGVKTVMTDSDLPTGSDRIWSAIKNESVDVVINIQGDEPLLTGLEIDALVQAFDDNQVEMATLCRPIKNREELENPSVAKIILNSKSEALYFSRLAIPYTRETPENPFICVKHIGFYGYTKDFLKRFCSQTPVSLERAEGLEQLRALWLGAKIKVVPTEYESWGVDTPEDVIRVEEMIRKRRQK